MSRCILHHTCSSEDRTQQSPYPTHPYADRQYPAVCCTATAMRGLYNSLRESGPDRRWCQIACSTPSPSKIRKRWTTKHLLPDLEQALQTEGYQRTDAMVLRHHKSLFLQLFIEILQVFEGNDNFKDSWTGRIHKNGSVFLRFYSKMGWRRWPLFINIIASTRSQNQNLTSLLTRSFLKS